MTRRAAVLRKRRECAAYRQQLGLRINLQQAWREMHRTDRSFAHARLIFQGKIRSPTRQPRPSYSCCSVASRHLCQRRGRLGGSTCLGVASIAGVCKRLAARLTSPGRRWQAAVASLERPSLLPLRRARLAAASALPAHSCSATKPHEAARSPTKPRRRPPLPAADAIQTAVSPARAQLLSVT